MHPYEVLFRALWTRPPRTRRRGPAALLRRGRRSDAAQRAPAASDFPPLWAPPVGDGGVRDAALQRDR